MRILQIARHRDSKDSPIRSIHVNVLREDGLPALHSIQSFYRGNFESEAELVDAAQKFIGQQTFDRVEEGDWIFDSSTVIQPQVWEVQSEIDDPPAAD